MGTKNNPAKHDCYANANPDEPMFVLLGRDVAASPIVRLWAAVRRRIKSEPELEDEAIFCAGTMTGWAMRLGKDAVAGERAFEDAVLELADEIRERRSSNKP